MHSVHPARCKGSSIALVSLPWDQTVESALDVAPLRSHSLNDIGLGPPLPGPLQEQGVLLFSHKQQGQQMLMGLLWYTLSVVMAFWMLQGLGLGLITWPLDDKLDMHVSVEHLSLAGLEYALLKPALRGGPLAEESASTLP
jgi:hypothetical protein